MSRFLLCSLTTLAFVGSAFSVRADDELDRIRQQQEVAVQKLKADVAGAIEKSRNLQKTSTEEARNVLTEMLGKVRDSRFLVESVRSSLTSQLQARVTAVDEVARVRKVAEDQRVLRDPPPTTRRPVNEAGGSGVSGVAKGFQDSAKGAQQVAADSIRTREKTIVAVTNSLEKVLPADKDFSLPPYWKQLTEHRKNLVNQQLTAKEIALLKTLNSVMSVDYNNEKFKLVINHLQDKTGLTLILDEASARDLNIDYDDPISFKVQKASVRTILKKVLGDKGLTYIIKEGNIQVMTPKRASEHTVVRSYPVDDLVAPNQFAMFFGPFAQYAQMQQNAQQLINLIQSTVEPASWQPNGPGSITFHAPTKTLLIRASAEMHYQMASPGLFGR